MKQLYKNTAGALLTLGFVAAAPLAFAHTGGVTIDRESRGQGVQLSQDIRDDLRDAFTEQNYSGYLTIAEENDLPRTLTEQEFKERAQKKQERDEKRQAVKTEILEGDYQAWRTIVGDDRATGVTVSNFSLLTDLVEARENDDEDAIKSAKQALKDAGIKKPKKGGKRGGRGWRGERT